MYIETIFLLTNLSYKTKSGDKNNPKLLGKQVGEELRSKGINDLALNWRQKVEEWNTT